MPLYIPWLTDTIKKRGVRYLLHHYLGQFFEEKLTLEQLSIDIYEGKGSIRNLSLDVDGLNDELDFIPFTFLDGCSIEQISVEVPWSSLVTDACRVELDGAKFFCRLKTTADSAKHHCTESTLLSRSLMTSSMQMAEEIVSTEDDEDIDSHHPNLSTDKSKDSATKKKDASQMFEGLEMFAQLIDSVLRRTKLTARNTLFQIQPHDGKEIDDDGETDPCSGITSRDNRNQASSRSSGDEFCEPTANSDTDDENHLVSGSDKNQAKSTVEFFIRFFRCEEMIDQTRAESELDPAKGQSSDQNDELNKSPCAIPETVTKLLTLEDVEMRIDGLPVSNLIGKHTITIKFNGQKSEISIFSGSPLLAVISHQQLETFFNVFDGSKGQDIDTCSIADRNQKPMRAEDYAKIENQLLESASLRNIVSHESSRMTTGAFGAGDDSLSNNRGAYLSTQGVGLIGSTARRWGPDNSSAYSQSHSTKDSEYGYQSPNSSTLGPFGTDSSKPSSDTMEPTLDHIEAFSCELKLPGIWLCIIRSGERLPPLIKPYADSINSFQTINKYINNHIKVPHIRCLALKVALDITAAGTNIFLADLDVSEHLVDSSRMSPVLKLVHNDQANTPMNSSRYKASINKGKDITIDLLTRTRVMFDPTIIDRIVYDYKLVKLNSSQEPIATARSSRTPSQITLKKSHTPDLNLTLRGERFKLELLCPIPDLTPDAHTRQTQLRPQSFIFDFRGMILSWQSDKLTISSNELLAYVKTQPMQCDNEAVKFVESTSRGSDKVTLVLEPSPSDLDNAFCSEVEQALNESSMFDSIYVSQATESRLPTDPFQTKRKLVRASFQSQQQQQTTNKPYGAQLSECDHEKILTPGDRQHLLDYLNQTLMATKLSLNLHLPVCRVEFEDKEQLDLIYNRFGNDFVFWQPRALTKVTDSSSKNLVDDIHFRPPRKLEDDDGEHFDQEEDDEPDSNFSGRQGSQNSFHSIHNDDTSSSDRYDNEVTCKIIVDELFVKFNHQSCAAALKQEFAAENFLLGVIIDVNKKPNTLLSLVADNLELSTDLETVLERNFFTGKNSVFALTAEIKRPTKLLKDIKLAIQLNNGLFNDFRSETYTRFWQSINVTDEPILGYIAPQIVTELHIDILNTSLMLVREDARPALLSIDELYMTSMVMEQTSQVMIRLIADEVSLYMKRDRQGLETMKNYICLIDSGLIDLDVKFDQAGRLEFGVINNVITVRVCQDSLNALCKLFNVLIRSSSQQKASPKAASALEEVGKQLETMETGQQKRASVKTSARVMKKTSKTSDKTKKVSTKTSVMNSNQGKKVRRKREMNLLADAMNDYSITSRTPEAQMKETGKCEKEVEISRRGNTNRSSDDEEKDVDDEDYVQDKKSVDDSSSHDESEECEEDEDKADYDSDSDSPPVFQRTASSSSSTDGHAQARNPNACLLDESNPMLGDMFSPPLMPSSGEKLNNNSGSGRGGGNSSSTIINPSESTNHSASHSLAGSRAAGGDVGDEMMNPRAMDESGFFVIGDDDVGAGIIDKKQHEPVVRKLIDGPINIIDNHFKMTKPRTIPEMLATSLERYVLEEMTLVVNLFGGHDFDDEDTPVATNDDTASSSADMADQASEATNELLDTITAESQLIRSRAGSMASARHSGSLKRPGRLGGRRKHLSEGGGDLGLKMGEATQRVRFGEGAVNLWESLDLMSSPDFLGARPRPSQPALNSDSKQAGGTWRENDVCIQLTLSKVKLLYEVADGTIKLPDGQSNGTTKLAQGCADEPNLTPPISSRFMLFIQDIEVKDRIAASDINKMLYEYCSESMPKRSTQMLSIKNIATINPSDGCEECDLRVSLKPLRLNIDQDTLLFLIEFCTTFCKVLTKQQQQQQQDSQQSQSSSSSSSATRPSGGASALRTNPSKQVDGISCASGNARQHEPNGEASGRGNSGLVRSVATTGKVANRVLKQAHGSQSCSSSAASSLSTSHMTRSGTPGKRQSDAETTTATSATSSSGTVCGGGNFNRNGRVVNENDIAFAEATTVSDTSGSKCVDSGGSSSGCNNDNADRQLEHNSDESDEDYWESSEEMDDDEAQAAAAVAGKTEIVEDSDEEEEEEEDDDDDDDNDDEATSDDSRGVKASTSAGKRPLPTHCHANDLSGAPNQQPIYIKSFTFSPDVPIRIDYHAKHLDFEQGALAGILMGLAHLDHSELILRRVQAKHGMRGLDRVLLFAINSWLSDIKRNQLPSILGGVGPMHSVIQLFQGMRDLVWMPIDHYRKDGRLVRGLQRGASSFSSSTAMAAINLVNRFISIVQCTAQIAHDIVTPPSMLPAHSARRLRMGSGAGVGAQLSSGSTTPTGVASSRRARHRHHARHLSSQEGPSISHGALAGAGGLAGATGLNQPRNFCEGVAVGFNIIKEGFNDTARNVTVGMQADDMRSAVGELVRQIPSTLLNPIISATEGAQSVLVGIRNQIAPDARRDDQEKWKGRVRGK